jgi:hypothetical protein
MFPVRELEMSPGRPAGSIKTVVPRHNAQRIDARLVTEVGTIARGQGLKVDLCQHDPSNAVAQAIVSVGLFLPANQNR